MKYWWTNQNIRWIFVPLNAYKVVYILATEVFKKTQLIWARMPLSLTYLYGKLNIFGSCWTSKKYSLAQNDKNGVVA